MADPLDDRFDALRAAPVPPLPGAAAARLRGERRTRRTRVALAGAGAVVVAVAITAGAALGAGGGGTQTLPLATSPPVEPPPPPPPTEPAEEPRVEPSGAPWVPQQAFLSPDDAAAAEQPGWAPVAPGSTETLLDPCGEGAVAMPPGAVLAVERVTLSSRREAGGSSLVQEVTRYDGAASAGVAFDAYTDRVARCDGRPMPGDPGAVERLMAEVGAGPGGLRTALIRRVPCYGDACTDHFATYALLAQAGDGLALAEYAIAEDGDPADDARALLEALGARLLETVAGTETTAADPVYFRSPSGRVHCSLTPTHASCDITEFDYEPPPRPADCDLDWGGMVVLDSSGASFVCHGDTNAAADARVLPYGETLGNDAWTCTSRETGMTCRERDGDRGFTLSRARYELT